MKSIFSKTIIITISLFIISCNSPHINLTEKFQSPPESAKPWTFWYWRKAAVSKKGIKKELIAMKNQGIGGAYLFTIQGAEDPPLFEPPAEQLTPYWWELLRYTFKIADSLGLKLGMHACDGFTVAGGPWITPEMSMQKIVWKDTVINGGNTVNVKLPKPEHYENYYEDIATFAYPTPNGSENSTRNIKPKVTCSLKDKEVQFLADPDGIKQFRSTDSCWIQYEFEKPFTCSTIEIYTRGNNLQSHLLIIEKSDDGKNFTTICRLKPPRHGWQDYDAPITHSIVPSTARFFHFVYDLKGTLPAAEDYDAAKWRQSLRITGIVLSGKPTIHQYEGKTGAIWRVSEPSTNKILPDSLCISTNQIIDVSSFVDKSGVLNWQVPEGKWTILRIGHTSNGHTNYIGGSGEGLECDKFNPEIVKFQFDNWFGKVFDELGDDLTKRVLKIFHVDSWEAGSQNWSPVFRDEFKKRRGYDLYPYLPVMAGVPVQSAEISERFLQDIRQTIAELLVDNFFGTLAELARKKGCVFSAESVAPTFTSDGMLHFKEVDIPMGEFWYNSPTHDKPNDMLDAISSAHIYGKKIIQSESFTTLRMEWNEHPGTLKKLGDRNFALGINRFTFHVLTHNPWLDRKPGMTLDGVGLYFQPDQTWWNSGKAWIEYITRCQALLQQGSPVIDIAIYTGEEVPRRALTPDRLIEILPGLFDPEQIEKEKLRQANKGIPYQIKPVGVTNTVNTFNPANWIDPLRGYHYDSFNKDALLNLARVENGKIVFSKGSSYNILVIPGSHLMMPDGKVMSPEVAEKLIDLANQGATIILGEIPVKSTGLYNANINDDKIKSIFNERAGSIMDKVKGQGKIITGAYYKNSFEEIGIKKDFYTISDKGTQKKGIAWCHRKSDNFDIYFISNQKNEKRIINISLRCSGKIPEIFNPINGKIYPAKTWKIENNRTELPIFLEPSGSLFIVLQHSTKEKSSNKGSNWITTEILDTLKGSWFVKFDQEYGGPEDTKEFKELTSWSESDNSMIKYYSGTALYSKEFNIHIDSKKRIFINFGQVENLAEVIVNNKKLGVVWTQPYRIDISDAIIQGKNKIEIAVTNTWANRLIGDHTLPEEQKVTWTTAPYRLQNKPLALAGLLGPVLIEIEQ